MLHDPVQITTVDEAKQFYPLFGLGANVALIFSGRAVVAFSKVSLLRPTSRNTAQSLSTLAVFQRHMQRLETMLFSLHVSRCIHIHDVS
mgnify:CR=1 FL=1